MDILTWLESFVQDVRYAGRSLPKNPGFAIVAILRLALGIGVNTATFTLIHAVMPRSLPVGDPSLLCRIGDGDESCGEAGPPDRWGMFSFPLYERIKAETPESERLAAFQVGAGRVSV